jgi:hypothetical protein
MAVYPVCKNDPGVAVNLNLGIVLKATGGILTICVIIILLLMFGYDMCNITFDLNLKS